MKNNMLVLAIFDIVLGALFIAYGVFCVIRYEVKISPSNISDDSTVGVNMEDGRRAEMTGKEFFDRLVNIDWNRDMYDEHGTLIYKANIEK